MKAGGDFWRDPALPYAESRRACDSRAAYRPHSHATWSIGAVDAGRSRFHGAGPEAMLLEPGTVVIVPAGQVHACNPEPRQAWSYQMLHLDAAWVDAILPAGNAIRVLRDPWAYRLFCQTNTLLFSRASPALKENALIELVAKLHGAPAQILSRPCASRGLSGLIAALREQAAAPPALGELARQAGMSRYQLIRTFRKLTGLPPHAWILDQRIIQAREHLRAGRPLAEVALELGFADQSHFQRVFKAHTATTPGHYRAAR